MNTAIKNPDLAVVIGRVQLPHKGHSTLFAEALKRAPRLLVVLGSAWRARDTRNPFNAAEREQMVLAGLPAADRERVSFLPVRDYFDDARWDAAVLKGVKGVKELTHHSDNVVLVGFKKDSTSEYLDHFPGWGLHEVMPTVDIDATSLRKVFFEDKASEGKLAVLSNYVEPGVLAYLKAWEHLPPFERLVGEYAQVAAYRKKYSAPFYLTADSVVTADNHVLLIRRGGDIGHGLWALPGGFVNKDERFFPAALRELREETGLGLLESSLKRALRTSAVFDHPLRSPRGRLVTHAFHFDLGDMRPPEVQGSDDAMEAKWMPIAELPGIEESCFEDHSAILDHFVGVYRDEG